MSNKLPPAYMNLRIYALAVVLYLMLVFPVSLIMLFKYGPMWMEEKGLIREEAQSLSPASQQNSFIQFDLLSQADSLSKPNESKSDKNIVVDDDEIRFGTGMSLLFRIILLGSLLIFLVNYPFQRHSCSKADFVVINYYVFV